MKKKKTSKDKAWEWFSRLTRIKEVDSEGYGYCISCGKRVHFKQAQAGHFVPGRTNSILWDERNCHLQCVGCNYFGSGKAHVRYYEWMLKNYGQDVINEIYKNALILKKIDNKEFDTMAEKYKLEFEKISRTKCIEIMA